VARKQSTPSWSLREIALNSHIIDWKTDSRDHEVKLLVISDAHWDNPDCNRDLLSLHMQQAVEMDAPIIHCGDWFCMMQGKYDPRSNKSKVLPEHQNDKYIASLISTAAEWLKPYSKHLVLLGQGNHETSVAKRLEFCVLEALTERIQSQGGITRVGGYSGFIKLGIQRAQQRHSKRLWYDHGFGGGGPVTMGKIDFNRYMSRVDADIIVAGHVHHKEAFPVRLVTTTATGRVIQKEIWNLRCGSYKDEFRGGEGGWHVERGMGPRPLGGWWVIMYPSKRGGLETYHIAIEPTRY
jgi:predicted phosphodiesterase